MRTTRINHASIVANSLDESARFYEELFGMERIPTAKFPDPVLWLRAGTSQLHLFEADETADLRPTCRSTWTTSTRSTRRPSRWGSSTPCVRLAAP